MGKLQIILTEDFPNLGQKWEVKRIKVGFYRNHPHLKQKAWLYNSTNYQRAKKKQEAERIQALRKEENAQIVYQQINGLTLSFALKKGDKDQVFGSVRLEEILKELKSRGFSSLEKSQFLDFIPLNKLGDNWLKIRLSENLIASLKIAIIAEE